MAQRTPQKRGRGAPCKLTPELQAEVCKSIEIAISLAHAATEAGIRKATLHEWLLRGETGEEPYAGFAWAVERARSRAVKNLTVRALSGGKGSQWATWLLERRFREDYGPVNRIDQTIDLSVQKLIDAFEPPPAEEKEA